MISTALIWTVIFFSKINSPETITLKIYFKDDIRSFDVDHLTFEKLSTLIKKEYGSDVLMKYQDNEGELVTLTGDSDVK